jgi:hypothetical protein
MPQLMSRPKSACPGPQCGGCSSASCMADGGKVSDDQTLGSAIGYPGSTPPPTKPVKMAEGGAVDSWTKREDNEKGVNKGSDGISKAGLHVRSANHESVYSDKEDSIGAAKIAHKKTLGEMSSMPKPKLMAEGGEVSSDDAPSDDDGELHDMLGGELMGAFERKDKKAIMSAIEACVMQCMNKE